MVDATWSNNLGSCKIQTGDESENMDWSRYGNPEMVDWEDRGYFAYGMGVAATAASRRADLLPQADDHIRWQLALAKAKRGDFSGIPALIELAAGDTHPTNRRLCAELLGDAGPASAVDAIAGRLSSGEPSFELTLAWSSVLMRRGRLSDVPIVLAAFEQVAEIRDADILAVHISECLESGYDLADPQDHRSFAHYRHAVLARCAELADRYGSDEVLLDAGERLSVNGLARRTLERLREPYFPCELRRRFECATGIDCSSFYNRRTFNPMAATALLEDFLKGATAHEDGVRCFFGHRIP